MKLFQRLIMPFIILLPLSVAGQNYSISGTVIEARDKSVVISVPVTIAPITDTARKRGMVTDIDGHFVFDNTTSGTYLLTIQGLGYTVEQQRVRVTNASVSLGKIELRASSTALKNVTVAGQQVRAEQNGDTTAFNANAYKVNPDASAEDLIKKMPGVTSDGNGVKVNGEEVKKVLVDGKPFFGDDPNASLKNLPAEIVDRVEIFDNQSDQARFTGFNDGNQEKTINLVTKRGKNEGMFGKVYGGYGTDGRYQGGLTMNYFAGSRRISLLGLFNNINQQNFSIADVMSAMGNSGTSGGGPGGPGGGSGNTNTRSGGSGNSFGGPGGLLTNQQSGITGTKSIGLNYSDEWGKKINVSGSYFFNKTDNDNQSELTRSYFTDSSLGYQQMSRTRTINTNHRATFRFEYNIDESNALTVTPRITFQHNEYATTLNASTLQAGQALNTTATNQSANANGYSFTNNILYQHLFNKKGRTVSLNLGQQLSNQNGNGTYYSNSYYASDTTAEILDQHYTNSSRNNTFSGGLTYTEPLGRNGQLMANYSPSYNTSKANKETNDRNGAAGEYVDLDTTLSNRYNSNYTTHKGGLGYRYNKGKMNLNLGLDAQQSRLTGDQTFPVAFQTDRSFSSVLPSAMLNIKFRQSENLNINYRTSNNAPSISQLQSVPDVSNPLQVTSGNPDLQQTYEHSMRLRYSRTNKATARSFFVFGMFNYTADYISNATNIARQDTIIEGGYRLNAGSQLTSLVNLDNYYSARVFSVYSLPLKSLKSNLNLNGGVTFNHTPALINNMLNYSNNTALNGGLYLGSNISQYVDFSVSYNGSYNVVNNTVNKVSNNSYYNGNAKLSTNILFRNGLVFNTDVTHTMYSGLSESYNLDFLLWNASVGYKFLKDRSLEAKLSMYDILKQNQSVSRTVSDAYTQDTKTNVLQRYGMLTLTYTLRHFKKGSSEPESRLPGDMPPPPPGGMNGPPPGGMGGPPPMN